jgi:hypothetical protein
LANQRRKDSFGSGGFAGNNLEPLSTGEHRLLGIPFQIGESVLQVGSTGLPNRYMAFECLIAFPSRERFSLRRSSLPAKALNFN